EVDGLGTDDDRAARSLDRQVDGAVELDALRCELERAAGYVLQPELLVLVVERDVLAAGSTEREPLHGRSGDSRVGRPSGPVETADHDPGRRILVRKDDQHVVADVRQRDDASVRPGA